MTSLEREMEHARITGRILGLVAFLKDCKELKISPDYLRIESELIKYYDQYQKLKETK